VKNFHLPLPERTYAELRAAAERSRVPATSMAREAIQQWLLAREKAERHRAIAAYAAGMGGSPWDLDRSLEAATIELLMANQPK